MTITITTKTVKDGNGNPVLAYVGTDGTNFYPLTMLVGADGTHLLASMDAPARAGYQILSDGTNTVGLAQFHNADGQSLGTSYGLVSGGLTQLLNGAGTLDRQRSANADAMAVTGLAAGAGMTFNGTTWDRSRSVNGDAMATTGIQAATDMLYNGTTFDRPRSVSGDGMAITGLEASVDMLWNGTTFDRPRSASSANGTTGTGIEAAGAMGFDGTNARWLSTDTTGKLILGAGTAFIGSVGGNTANPTATLTRPANTTAYAQNNLVASNTTAGSAVVPSISVARIAAGSCYIRRIRLLTNATSGWGGVTLSVSFWAAAPTYTYGDGGAYAVATGAANYLGSCVVTLNQFGDGASGIGNVCSKCFAG